MTSPEQRILIFRENKRRHLALAKLALPVFGVSAGLVILVLVEGGQPKDWIGMLAVFSGGFALIQVAIYCDDPVGRTLSISEDRLTCLSPHPKGEKRTEVLFDEIRRIKLRYPTEDHAAALIFELLEQTFTLRIGSFEIEMLELADLIVDRLQRQGRRVEEETGLFSKYFSGFKVC